MNPARTERTHEQVVSDLFETQLHHTSTYLAYGHEI